MIFKMNKRQRKKRLRKNQPVEISATTVLINNVIYTVAVGESITIPDWKINFSPAHKFSP